MHLRDLLIDEPPGYEWSLVLAHGAGQGMDSPFMDKITRLLLAASGSIGGLRLIRFEFPYMVDRRRTGKKRPPDRGPVLLESWSGVINALIDEGTPARRLLIGGKSMGGRMASLVAVEHRLAGLVCLGYPFHAPGRPDRLRVEHFPDIKIPMLVCQGERDAFGRRREVEGYRLPTTIRWCWLPDGDHGFKPRKSSGFTEGGNLQSAAEAVISFIAGL